MQALPIPMMKKHLVKRESEFNSIFPRVQYSSDFVSSQDTLLQSDRREQVKSGSTLVNQTTVYLEIMTREFM